MRFSLCIVLLSALALAPRAGAAEWKPVGTFNGPAVAAGGGAVVAADENGAIAVLGGAAVSRRLDVPAGCAFEDVAGGERAIAECPDPGWPDRRAAIVDLATGASKEVHLPERPENSGSPTLQITPLGIGRRWMALSYFDSSRNVSERYWNPATGAVHEVEADEPLFANLDAEQPVRRPCRPVVLVRDTVSYPEPPFPHARRTGRWVVYRGKDGVRAWRCGHKRPIRVTRCPAACGDGSFNAGYGLVAWPTSRGVHAMALNSRRRFRLGGPRTQNAELAFGGRRIYASVPDGDRKTFEVFVARLPRS